MYVRATQGHNLSFVREARLAIPLTTSEEFKVTTIATWNATSERSAASILEQGLVPGGCESYGGRNAVRLIPAPPWGGNFKAYYFRGATTKRSLDP